MRHLASSALILVATACSPEPNGAIPSECLELLEEALGEDRLPKGIVVDLDEVMNPAAALQAAMFYDGSTGSVEGWLTSCEELSCQLSSTPDAEKLYQRFSGVSVGSNPDLNQQLYDLAGHKVRLRVRLDRTCLISGCLDRAGILMPLAVEEVLDTPQ